MTPEAWASLAAQAPIVVIFAVVVIYILKQQYTNTKELMGEQYRQTQELTDKFMLFLESHDKMVVAEMKLITASMQKDEEQTKIILTEARVHDRNMHNGFKDIARES